MRDTAASGLRYAEEPASRPRGRPELPEKDRKIRVTFSVTRKAVDRFYEACSFNGEDPNRLVESLMDGYSEKQESPETMILQREELIEQMDGMKRRLELIDSKLEERAPDTIKSKLNLQLHRDDDGGERLM